MTAGERGPGTHRPYPCLQCPNERFPPLDPLSLRTLEAHHLLVSLSGGLGGAPPLMFVFSLLRLRVPSDEAREVAERLALLWTLQRQHHEDTQSQQSRNGAHGRVER